MDLSKNLDLWNRVEKTNPDHTKQVTFGRSITAIDPYRQIKNATEQFGPAGQGWGWEVRQVETFSTNEVAVLVRVWIKGQGHIEQWGQNSLYIDKAEKKKDTDHMKKATTDGLTKCLSCMGFNADVFLGKFEDSKYVQGLKEEFKEPSYTFDQISIFNRWLAEEDSFRFCLFVKTLNQDVYDELYNTFPQGKKTEFKKIAMKLEIEGNDIINSVAQTITELVEKEDHSYVEHLEGLTQPEKGIIASRLSADIIEKIKIMKGDK